METVMRPTHDTAALPLAPEKCPCGQLVRATSLEALRKVHRHVYACPACSTRYRVPGAAPAPTVAPAATVAAVAAGSSAATQVPAVAALNAQVKDALGWVLWWSLSGVDIARAALVALVQAAGLDAKAVPATTDRGALSKACQRLDLPHGVKLHEFPSTADGSSFGLIESAAKVDPVTGRPADPTVSWLQVVSYSSSGPAKGLTFRFPGVLEQEIRAGFEHWKTHVDSDKARETIQRCLDAAHATRLRAQGGVMFLPASSASVVQAVQALADKVQGASVTALALAASAETAQVVRVSVGDEIKGQLAEAERDLGAILERCKDVKGRETLRDSTLAARVKRFRSLREKGRCYAELIHLDVAEVECRLAKLEAQVEELF